MLRRSARCGVRQAAGDGLRIGAGRLTIRRAADAVRNHEVRSTKTGTRRVVAPDPETLRVLKYHKAARGALSRAIARRAAFEFGDDEGCVHAPDSISQEPESLIRGHSALCARSAQRSKQTHRVCACGGGAMRR